jgi:hypothetical protein
VGAPTIRDNVIPGVMREAGQAAELFGFYLSAAGRWPVHNDAGHHEEDASHSSWRCCRRRRRSSEQRSSLKCQDRLVDDRRIRRPKHFSHPRNAPGGNDREAGSRYGPPRHGSSFSFTRNPLYLAGTTLVLGIGLVSGIVLFLLLVVLAAFAVQKLAIEREERHLQA